jgi:hypothetical protein
LLEPVVDGLFERHVIQPIVVTIAKKFDGLHGLSSSTAPSASYYNPTKSTILP